MELSVRNVARVSVQETVQWLRTHPKFPQRQWQTPTGVALELLPPPACGYPDATHWLSLEFARLLEAVAVAKNVKTLQFKNYRQPVRLAHKPVALSDVIIAMLALPDEEKPTLTRTFSPVVQEARKYLRTAPAPSNENLATLLIEREAALWLVRAVLAALGQWPPVQSLDWVPVVLS